MIGKIIFVVFLIYRIYSWYNKTNAKNSNTSASKKAKKNKNLDDVLGDFMKQLEQKKNLEPQTVSVNTDTHKAEEDSGRELDWQEVNTSKFKEKKQLLSHSDYKNISHQNKNIEQANIFESEESEDFEMEEIDLRKAVLYKEILERKYFTI